MKYGAGGFEPLTQGAAVGLRPLPTGNRSPRTGPTLGSACDRCCHAGASSSLPAVPSACP